MNLVYAEWGREKLRRIELSHRVFETKWVENVQCLLGLWDGIKFDSSLYHLAMYLVDLQYRACCLNRSTTLLGCVRWLTMVWKGVYVACLDVEDKYYHTCSTAWEYSKRTGGTGVDQENHQLQKTCWSTQPVHFEVWSTVKNLHFQTFLQANHTCQTYSAGSESIFSFLCYAESTVFMGDVGGSEDVMVQEGWGDSYIAQWGESYGSTFLLIQIKLWLVRCTK